MIRNEDMSIYLRCLVEELNGSIRRDLQSDYSKNRVDALVLVLRRLIAQSDVGNAAAGKQLDEWEELAEEVGRLFGAAVDTVPAASASAHQQLDFRVSSIQRRLHDPQAFEQLVHSLHSGDATAWFKKSVKSLNEYLQEMENALRWPQGRQGAAGVADNLEGLRDRLGKYLCERYPQLPADPIADLAVSAGGQVKRTALFRLPGNDVLPSRLVLRQDMEGSFSDTVVTDEYEILRRVYDMGLPVPRPILVEADPSILGGRFMIMTEIEDALGAGTYFAEERRHYGHTMQPVLGREVAGVLARLHAGTLDVNPQAGAVAARERMEAVDQLRDEMLRREKQPAFSLTAELGLAWLKAHPLSADRPRCLTHQDIGAHNLMTRNGHLAAVLDWELAKIGDPAEDLAQARMMLLEDVLPWEDFARAYVEQGGPPAAIEPHAVSFYCIWTYLRHGALNMHLWDLFLSGARDDAPAASIAGHFIDRLLLYQSRALTQALQI